MSLRTFAHSKPEKAARFGVWLLGAGETIIWACIFYIFAALLLTWEQDLGWAKTDLTLGFSLAILAAAVASPLAGRVIDAGHGRWALGGGAFFGGLGLVALSQVDNVYAYMTAWIVIGFAQGFALYEPCFSVVTRAKGADARPAITHITLMAGFASPLSFMCAAALLGELDWQATTLVFAAASILLATPALYIGTVILEAAAGDKVHSAPKDENRAALHAALRKPAFWLIALAFPLMAVNHGILLNHIFPLLAERNVPETMAILVASTIGPSQVAGRMILVAIQHRVSTLTVSVFAFSGVVVSSLLLIAAGVAPWLSFAFAVIQGASYGLTSIIKPAITADFLGRTGFGTINGWLALPYLCGFAFAPHIGSLVWEAGGYDLVIPFAVAVAVAGVICMLALAALGRNRNDGGAVTPKG